MGSGGGDGPRPSTRIFPTDAEVNTCYECVCLDFGRPQDVAEDLELVDRPAKRPLAISAATDEPLDVTTC